MTGSRKAAFLAIASCAMLVPSAAISQERIVVEGGQPTARVGYADLDLSQHAGVRTLQTRVNGAARQLCLQTGVTPLPEMLNARRCVKGAIEDAGHQIDMAIASYRQDRFASRSAAITIATRR